MYSSQPETIQKADAFDLIAMHKIDITFATSGIFTFYWSHSEEKVIEHYVKYEDYDDETTALIDVVTKTIIYKLETSGIPD